MLTELRNYLEKEDLKTYIVEIGAGCPIAHGLYQCPGASKVVYHSESPYGSAKHKYPSIGNHRMVSKEAVASILDSVKDAMIRSFNYIIATSFQVRSGEDDDRVPHGWVAVARYVNGEWEDNFYHLTLCDYQTGKFYSREKSLEIIADEVSAIILNTKENSTVDIGYEYNLLNSKCPVFFKDGKPVRLEDVTRKYRRIALYKGSFNPIHHGHVQIAKTVEDEDTLVIFAISKNTYQKGEAQNESILKRLEMIDSENFMCAVFEIGYFYDNVRYLVERTALYVDLIMGVDTFNRLIKCYETFEFSASERSAILGFISMHKLDVNTEAITVEDVIAKHRSLIFNWNFRGIGFQVFGRKEEPHVTDIMVDYVFHRNFDCAVSSSEIRQLVESGDTETANKLKKGSL